MIQRYIAINRLLRAIHARAMDGVDAEQFGADGYAQGAIGDYITRDVRDLEQLWPRELDGSMLTTIREAATMRDHANFHRIASELLPAVEDIVDRYFGTATPGDLVVTAIDFMHPVIVASSLEHFRANHFREAVLNGVVAIFDLIRERTGIDKDGANLVAEAFSLEHPRLVFSTLETESGRSDQKGFLQILQGTYVGVRNPKAHSLFTDLDQRKTGQYLAFLSLLARRVAEARLVPPAT
jgi:uncharacterized protein (TIGR02391 family)